MNNLNVKDTLIPREFRVSKDKACELYQQYKTQTIINSNLIVLFDWCGATTKKHQDTIESIVYIGKNEVFDMTIKDEHSYKSNGIFSHNCNLPQTASKKLVSDLYISAWESGCKGFTIYRDGSRTGVLVSNEKPVVKEEFLVVNAPKRPKELAADYYATTADGKKYAVIIGLWKDTTRPYEIFAFENPPAYKNTRGKIVKIKKGEYKFINGDFAIENVQLAADQIEQRSFTILMSMLLRHGAPLEHINNVAKKIDENIVSFSSACRRVLSKYIVPIKLDEACPECGSSLIREEGCVHCTNCSYSRC